MCMMLAENETQEDNLLILFAASRSFTSAMAKPNGHVKPVCMEMSNETLCISVADLINALLNYHQLLNECLILIDLQPCSSVGYFESRCIMYLSW